MEKLKVYVVGPSTSYASWLKDRVLVENIKDADVVMFTGGEDIDPSLYGKEKHRTTHSNHNRDAREVAAYKEMRPDQLALGICRGAQLLCALNGGILIQDVTNHACWETHPMVNAEGKELEITSAHHQMLYPFDLPKEDVDILYWASPTRSHHYEGDGVGNVPLEPEIVYFHKEGCPKGLAIQGHPEWMNINSSTVAELNKLLQSCLAEDR